MNSAKWLRVQNADLERKLEQHKPELANALSAREAAFTKLKHARKVIRDLLEERVGRDIVERTLDWRTDELFSPVLGRYVESPNQCFTHRRGDKPSAL